MIAVDRRYNSKRREDLEGSPECLSVEIECTKRVFYSDCFISLLKLHLIRCLVTLRI